MSPSSERDTCGSALKLEATGAGRKISDLVSGVLGLNLSCDPSEVSYLSGPQIPHLSTELSGTLPVLYIS